MCTPCLANTACTDAFNPLRHPGATRKVTYGGQRVLDFVSLHISRGET